MTQFLSDKQWNLKFYLDHASGVVIDTSFLNINSVWMCSFPVIMDFRYNARDYERINIVYDCTCFDDFLNSKLLPFVRVLQAIRRS